MDSLRLLPPAGALETVAAAPDETTAAAVETEEPLPPPPASEDAVARVLRLQRNDLFGVLGLQRGSGTDEVTRAYRRLVPLVHTDKVVSGDAAAHAAATEATQIVNAAREVLSDERKRRRYMHAMQAGARNGTWQRYERARQLDDARDAERDARRAAKCEARRRSEAWTQQRPPAEGRQRAEQSAAQQHQRQTMDQKQKQKQAEAQKAAKAQRSKAHRQAKRNQQSGGGGPHTAH